MKKTILILCIVFFLIVANAKPADGSGFDLMLKISDVFKKLGDKNSDRTQLVTTLQSCLVMAENSLTGKKIDTHFFKRYAQLVKVCILAIKSLNMPKNRAFDQLFLDEIKKMESAKGQGNLKLSFGYIASCIAEEIISLGNDIRNRK